VISGELCSSITKTLQSVSGIDYYLVCRHHLNRCHKALKFKAWASKLWKRPSQLPLVVRTRDGRVRCEAASIRCEAAPIRCESGQPVTEAKEPPTRSGCTHGTQRVGDWLAYLMREAVGHPQRPSKVIRGHQGSS
jgi:hypothetical protein